jgi:Protein of unknown function (DUF3565)
MKQRIVSYQQDEERHWIAILECNHTQHLRHNPPWTNRPWVTTDEGRERHIGAVLNCKKCETETPL